MSNKLVDVRIEFVDGSYRDIFGASRAYYDGSKGLFIVDSENGDKSWGFPVANVKCFISEFCDEPNDA